MNRANALNNLKLHDKAEEDAEKAAELKPNDSAAYSCLGKTRFYLKDFEGTISALTESLALNTYGEELSVFDQAYLAKAKEALAEELSRSSRDATQSRELSRSDSSIPKLAPPRFVAREEVISATPNIPPRPPKWPSQTLQRDSFSVGPERTIFFGEGALGVKLNRGSDGMVRILSTSVETGAAIAPRRGNIEAGDIVREASGVDLRRPITNIMWGDTVALIKMTPRPIAFIVAKELSTPPPSAAEDLAKAALEDMEAAMLRPPRVAC